MILYLDEVEKLAKKHGWFLICYQENIGMVSYGKLIIDKNQIVVKSRFDLDNILSGIKSINREKIRMNIYLTKSTVATCLKHPYKGKTQLFRKGVRLSQLEMLFINPRQHTGKGYYKKY